MHFKLVDAAAYALRNVAAARVYGLLAVISLLCAQAHLLVYFSKSGRGLGRFGEISPFVGFGPQTTLGGK